MECEQTNRRWNQQLARFVLQKLFRGVALEIIPRTHARYNKQQSHEPRVNQILKAILYLMFPEWPNHAKGLHSVEHIDHMVNHNKDYGHPADIIQIQFSCRVHVIPTFAMIFNTV